MNSSPRVRLARNIVLAALIVAGLVGGYFWLRKQRYRISALEPQFTTAALGDLTIPITATGVIEPPPESRVEIKSKASGEVIRIGLDPDDPDQQGTFLRDGNAQGAGRLLIEILSGPDAHPPRVWLDPDNPDHHGTFLHEGDFVKKGQLLIQLDPDDERRSVGLRQAEADLALANLEKARIEAEQGAPARVLVAKAAVDLLEWEYNRLKQLAQGSATAQIELQRTKSQLDDARAKFDLAQAQLKQAEQDSLRAQATHQQALIALEEAKERLAETTIRAPIDAQVVRINTRVGEVIQGGKTTITGGTVLMVLADIRKLYVVAEVDEADIGRVHDLTDNPTSAPAPTTSDELPTASGQVDITVDAFQYETFSGYISRIKPEPKKTSNITTYDVEILITSANRHKLMIGMNASVTFTAQRLQNVLLVENDAFRSDTTGQVGVYVPVPGPDGREKPQFHAVKRGLTDGLRTQVLAGLQPGQRVYTKLPVERSEEEK